MHVQNVVEAAGLLCGPLCDCNLLDHQGFHSLSWDDFQAYVDEREPKMLRAFTALEVNSAGQYELKHIKSTITKLGLQASNKNATAMIKCDATVALEKSIQDINAEIIPWNLTRAQISDVYLY